jgi:hypothetical protein
MLSIRRVEEFNESENALIYMRLYIYFECKCGGNSSWSIYTATCDPPPACRWKLKIIRGVDASLFWGKEIYFKKMNLIDLIVLE